MTIEDKDRLALIRYRIEKSRKATEDVRFLIDSDKLHLAVNRIYYGSFYMLTALALERQVSSTKHHQLIGWFNKTFVKENIVDREHGKFIHKAFDKRSKGDYADYITFEKEEVELMLKEMIHFQQEIEKLIFPGD